MRRLGMRAMALLALAGCSTAVTPASVSLPSVETTEKIAHADLAEVLRDRVDEKGLVDYRGLKRVPGRLERYYLWLSETSPDDEPELFPTRNDELAYWINAYNACVLVVVLRNYPIAGVADVRTPFPLSLVDPKIGFFFLQQVKLGGEETSLYALENSLIRPRFEEPRAHFALNCASRGCPQLPREPFVGSRLDEQLDREARRFFADERNLSIDHAERRVTLSSILDWYEDDFVEGYESSHPGQSGSLLAYALLYAPPEKKADLERAIAESYDVAFAPYDWSLNDQKPVR